MSEEELKYPWQSKTEWIAFTGIIYGLLRSHNAIPELTVGDFMGVTSLLFILIMIMRKFGTSGKVVFIKRR